MTQVAMTQVAGRFTALVAGLAVLVSSIAAWGQGGDDARTRGTAIVEAAHERHAGYRTLMADGKMTLFDAVGRQTERRFIGFVVEGTRGANKTLMEFHHPRDVKGTRLLTHGIASQSDMQWLYLPSIAHVKRVAGGHRKNSFMGSEFSYEDLTTSSIDKYLYQWIGMRPCPRTRDTCDLIERRPKAQGETAYSKTIVWIDQSRLLTQRAEHFDLREEPLKRLDFEKYILVDGKFWRVERAVMTNLVTGRRTELFWMNYHSGVRIPEWRFDPRRMGD